MNAEILKLVKLLKINAYNTYKATLIGGAPAYTTALFDELSHPKPGDLVMEVTTHYMKNRDTLEGIGRLNRIAQEPICTPEEAKEAGYVDGEEIPKHTVYYVALEFDDGRELRWHNAKFIKVKEDNTD